MNFSFLLLANTLCLTHMLTTVFAESLVTVNFATALRPSFIRALTVGDGDQVLVGEYTDAENQTTGYYIELSNEGDTDMPFLEQLQSGANSLITSFPHLKAVNVTAHQANNWLESRSVGKRSSLHKWGHFTATLKYGAKEGAEAITDFVLGIVSNLINSKVNDVMYGDNGGTECIMVTEPLPIGKNWYKGGATGNFGTCATKGNKCDTQAALSQLQKAANWADNSIDKYPYNQNYKIGFSNSGAWHLCIRVVRNENYSSKEAAYTAVEAMGCPKGYCDGGAFDRLPEVHDELK